MHPAQFHFTQHYPHNTGQYCTVHIGVSTTHKVSSTVSLLEHPHLVPDPSSWSQCQEQPANSQIHCNGTISLNDFTTWCYTNTECNSNTQMVFPVTIQCSSDSQVSIPILQVRFGVQNRSAMALHTQSLLLSTHNSSCTPLACLLGARRVDPSCDRLHMQIACRNRMPRNRDRDIAHL